MSAGVAPTLAEHVAPLAADGHVVAAAWLGGAPALALADGGVLLGAQGRRVAAHPEGGVLVAAAEGGRLVTGGDDGRIVETRPDGATETIAESGGAWIDALAIRPEGRGYALAYAAGRRVTARDAKGRERVHAAPTTARGLAFAPKGYRLAIAHYNGATLWFPNLDATPETLDWKGSHLDATWSRDGRFVVTTMQENALHGWRLQPDRGHMKMSGYPAKVRSVSWSSDGDWLATSGAEAAIVWPFDSREGPMGKQPRECGVRGARVSRVAFHPRSPVLAAGYEDGCILLVRFADAAELLVRRAGPGGAVTALAWDEAGRRLAFGCAASAAGVLSLPG